MKPGTTPCSATPCRRRGTRPALQALLLVALGLVGCPASDEEAAAPVAPRLEGYASDGFGAQALPTAVAAVGTRGHVTGFAGDNPPGTYRLDLTALQGPYILRAAGRRAVHGLAVGPGSANITLLTELAVADLFAARPAAVYDALDAGGSAVDIGRIEASAVAASEARVRALLARRFGLAWPAAVRPFTTAPAVLSGSDAMTQQLRSLQQRMADAQVLAEDLVDQVAQNARACATTSVVLRDPDDPEADADALCATGRAGQDDPGAAGERLERFTDAWGDALEVRLNDVAVLEVALLLRDGRRLACRAGACAGATATLQADGTRRLRFDGTRLVDGSRARVLRGELTTGNGPTTPGCIGEAVRVTGSDAGTRTQCIGRRLVTDRIGRLAHGFDSLVDGAWWLEVLSEGEEVLRIAIMDRRNGVFGAAFQTARCEAAECSGASLSAPDASGARTLTLAGTVLLRTDAAAAVVPGETLRLDGRLRTAVRPAQPPEPPCTRPGGAPALRLELAVAGGASNALCTGADWTQLIENDDDGDGVAESLSFVAEARAVDFAVLPSVRVERYSLVDGSIGSIVYSDLFASVGAGQNQLMTRAACEAAACPAAGIVVEGGPGSWQVRLQGLAVPERHNDGTPTGRDILITSTP